MMKKSLLATVAAAALIASAGLATAQRQEAPAGDVKGAAPPPAAIQRAPAEKMVPKASGGAEIKADSKAQTTGQAAPKADTKSGAEIKAGSDITAGSDTKSRASGTDKQDSSTAAQGQAQTGGSVALTTEQKSKIRTTVLTKNAPRVSNVNFSINVGTVVPRTVRLVAVPAPLLEIHPAWRGFLYFVHGDQIVIVEPGTLRIVTIIEV
jgi:uncharacterized protein DUF1236